jgi:hypothetical protein
LDSKFFELFHERARYLLSVGENVITLLFTDSEDPSNLFRLVLCLAEHGDDGIVGVRGEPVTTRIPYSIPEFESVEAERRRSGNVGYSREPLARERCVGKRTVSRIPQ